MYKIMILINKETNTNDNCGTCTLIWMKPFKLLTYRTCPKFDLLFDLPITQCNKSFQPFTYILHKSISQGLIVPIDLIDTFYSLALQ